jgi:hypothetical protein
MSEIRKLYFYFWKGGLSDHAMEPDFEFCRRPRAGIPVGFI